jgi:hypothetical protein
MEEDLDDEDTVEAEIEELTQEIGEEFHEKLEKHRRSHIEPMTEALDHLPKDKLGTLAKSLVRVTSLRRKFSIHDETVGARSTSPSSREGTASSG